MLFPTGTNHDVLYDDRVKKRETLIGHVNIFVKAEEELNRKTPASFMMRTIEKLVSIPLPICLMLVLFQWMQRDRHFISRQLHIDLCIWSYFAE